MAAFASCQCTAKRALAIAYRGKTMQAASGAAKADQGLALSHLHSQYARLFEPASCLACHRWQPAWLPTTFWPRTAARSEAASLPSWSRCTRLSVAALPEGAFRHGRCATNVPLLLAMSQPRAVSIEILSSQCQRWPSEVKNHPTGSAQRQGGSSRAAPCPELAPRTASRPQRVKWAHLDRTDWGRGMGL